MTTAVIRVVLDRAMTPAVDVMRLRVSASIAHGRRRGELSQRDFAAVTTAEPIIVHFDCEGIGPSISLHVPPHVFVTFAASRHEAPAGR